MTGIVLLYAAARNDKMATILSLIASVLSAIMFGVTAILIFIENHKNESDDENGNEDFDVKKELVAVLFAIMTMAQFYFLYCIVKFLNPIWTEFIRRDVQLIWNQHQKYRFIVY